MISVILNYNDFPWIITSWIKLPMDETAYWCIEFLKLTPWNKESISLLKWGVMSLMGERLSNQIWGLCRTGMHMEWTEIAFAPANIKFDIAFLGENLQRPWICIRIRITTLLKDYMAISNAQIYIYMHACIYIYIWMNVYKYVIFISL